MDVNLKGGGEGEGGARRGKKKKKKAVECSGMSFERRCQMPRTFARTATIGIKSAVMCEGMGSVDHSTITAQTSARHRLAGLCPLMLPKGGAGVVGGPAEQRRWLARVHG